MRVDRCEDPLDIDALGAYAAALGGDDPAAAALQAHSPARGASAGVAELVTQVHPVHGVKVVGSGLVVVSRGVAAFIGEQQVSGAQHVRKHVLHQTQRGPRRKQGPWPEHDGRTATGAS